MWTVVDTIWCYIVRLLFLVTANSCYLNKGWNLSILSGILYLYLFGSKNRRVPFRLKQIVENLGDLENRLSVLMISSPNHDDLVFPKVLSCSFYLYLMLNCSHNCKWYAAAGLNSTVLLIAREAGRIMRKLVKLLVAKPWRNRE